MSYRESENTTISSIECTRKGERCLTMPANMKRMYTEMKVKGKRLEKGRRGKKISRKEGKKKRVSFKENGVEVVDVESYKEYNKEILKENNEIEDKVKVVCSCIVY